MGLPQKICYGARLCAWCKTDQHFLRSRRHPRAFDESLPPVRVADLFAGCGGMTAGLSEAARAFCFRLEVSLAIDNDEAAIEIYKRNIPGVHAKVADVRDVFDGRFGSPLTPSERRVRDEAGKIDLLVGGPPCQGHSDLNNHTRRRDPKNVLLLSMARAAQVLNPSVVLVENVPPVRWDRNGVLDRTLKALAETGYKTAGAVINLGHVGVPQRRKRYLLVASKNARVTPSTVMAELERLPAGHLLRSVHWAIRDLMGVDSNTIYDSVGSVTSENRRRISFLFDEALFDLPNELRPKCHRDGNHSYVSVYGRLHWRRAAQTITTGFGSMGQGRYVHPQCQRTITPHEAARLQTFPDWFDFGNETPRTVLAKVIGNAVPPLFMRELGRIIIPKMIPALTKGTKRPAASSQGTLRRMQSTPRRDTSPERALRSVLHAAGYRFGVDRRVLPNSRRSADIVFVKRKVAVFVDGCFWHGCPAHRTLPKANGAWWAAKLKRNRERDIETNSEYRKAGWRVFRVWEHEEPAKAAARIISILEPNSVRARPRRPDESSLPAA